MCLAKARKPDSLRTLSILSADALGTRDLCQGESLAIERAQTTFAEGTHVVWARVYGGLCLFFAYAFGAKVLWQSIRGEALRIEVCGAVCGSGPKPRALPWNSTFCSS